MVEVKPIGGGDGVMTVDGGKTGKGSAKDTWTAMSEGSEWSKNSRLSSSRFRSRSSKSKSLVQHAAVAAVIVGAAGGAVAAAAVVVGDGVVAELRILNFGENLAAIGKSVSRL